MPASSGSQPAAGAADFTLERPGLAESMELLNSLPESVKSCLLEAARLCSPTGGQRTRQRLGAWSSGSLAGNPSEAPIFYYNVRLYGTESNSSLHATQLWTALLSNYGA